MNHKSAFNQDYKGKRKEPNPGRQQRLHWVLLAAGALAVPLTLGFVSGDAEAMRSDTASTPQTKRVQSGLATQRITIPLQLPPAKVSPEDQDTVKADQGLHTIQVKEGDTLSTIFDRLHLTPQQLHEVVSISKKTRRALTRLTPGQTLLVKVDDEGRLMNLTYKVDPRNDLIISRENGELQTAEVSRDYDTRVTFAKGTITSSLFEAAQEAGLSQQLTMEMAGIFGWDVDFALDIRENDAFVVMYEELYLDGKKVRDGAILAAEFINQGKSFRAVRYTDAKGKSDYYTPEGQSMRKAFLRTPVDFTRISSRYGKRYHPVLNRFRSHNGVDYAAPRGTPVKASGDGKVIFRGRKGGYGKTVVIQHGSKYSTLYAHLSSYARGARSGQRVRQGQIVGYVGSTGLATGPHLHYEFRVHGRHRNPLTVRLPKAAPIARRYKEDFRLTARTLLTQLDMVGNPTTAFSSL